MTMRTEVSSYGWPRRLLAGWGTMTLAIIWTHVLTGVLRPFGPMEAPLAALPVTYLAAAIALLAVATWSYRYSLLLVVGGAVLAGTALQIAMPGTWPASIALVVAGAASSEVGYRICRRLPNALDTFFSGRRLLAFLWLVLALSATVQIGRLSTYMTDPQFDWYLTTRHPFWAKHECLPAYMYAAELNQRGEENIYDAAHYPGLSPGAQPVTTLEGMTPEDPYQYTPQFLMLPHLFFSLSDQYSTIRLVWFGLQATLFLAVASSLAVWVGGRHGRLAALLLPVAVSAFPTLHALQFGQFHITAIALAVAGMLAFETRRQALGGALVAAAALSKIFPGILLVVLASQRRWRELAWSLGAIAAITLVALAVLGTAPFMAFFDYHLPRLSNGDAFAFDEAWPEVAKLIIADNQGAYGFVEKLRALGVPGLDKAIASRVATLFGLLLVGATALFGRHQAALPRRLQAAGWLALLGLGSMTSNGAFGDYVPLTIIWMLTLLASRMLDGWRVAVPLGLCWLFHYTLIGTAPLGDWFDPGIMIPLSAVALLTMLGTYGWVVVAGVRLARPSRQSNRATPGARWRWGRQLAERATAIRVMGRD
ncbi:MAG: glycosyltransferase family 87 protein [Acidobacteriota bacterium]